MAIDLSRHILEQVRSLSREEQIELVAEIERGLKQPLSAGTRRSIMELQGLGKEVWAGVDVKEYLRVERDSWNG